MPCPKYWEEALDPRAWANRIFEFVRAVVPLTLFCAGYLLIALQSTVLTVHVCLGMVCVIIGLSMFKFGLLTGLMTLGEVVGLKLPFRVSAVMFLVLAFGLGVLVTFAEPGINSLQLVGKHVESPPPLLNDVLTTHSSMLLISIALGVGMAASIGMQRIKAQWAIKGVIWASLLPLLLVTLFCAYLGPDFAVVIGLAWDCGAITTGPATVPIVLALGFGMCRTRKQQKEDPHLEDRHQALLTMLDRWSHHPTYQQKYKIIKDFRKKKGNDMILRKLSDPKIKSPKAKSPKSNVDAAGPAQKLPGVGQTKSFSDKIGEFERQTSGSSQSTTQSSTQAGKARVNRAQTVGYQFHEPLLDGADVRSVSQRSLFDIENDLLDEAHQASPDSDHVQVDHELFEKFFVAGEELDCFGIVTLASLYPILCVLLFCLMRYFIGVSDDTVLALPGKAATEVEEEVGMWQEIPLAQMKAAFIPVATLVSFMLFLQYGVLREGLKDVGRIAVGVGACFIGLSIFDIGLETGSIPLGQKAGEILPTALGETYGLGVILPFGFITGVIATIIDLEPCGLGETVELLSNGKFKKLDLFVSVSVGVGFGIVLGMLKIIYDFQVIYVILIGYSIALFLTHFSDDGITCVAWDSAGVTTGPVTVPLVLSMGIGICNHLNRHRAPGAAPLNGFGVLTCASVCPIVTVLLMGLYKLGPVRREDSSDSEGSSPDVSVNLEKANAMEK